MSCSYKCYCGGLNEYDPDWLMYSNTYCPVNGTRRLGSNLMEVLCPLREDFKSLNTWADSSLLSLLHACYWKCELSSLFLQQPCPPAVLPPIPNDPYPSGIISVKEQFCLYIVSVMVFYHSNRRIINTVTFFANRNKLSSSLML